MAARKKNRDWTLILIADNGPTASFQIRRRLFRVLIILFVGILAVGGAMLYFHDLELKAARDQLEQQLESAGRSLAFHRDLNRDLTEKVRELEETMQLVLRNFDEEREEEASAVSAEWYGDDITIDNFEVKREAVDTTIRFRFVLRNTDPLGEMKSGFVFVVYRPHYLDSDTWQIFPSTSLSAGMPRNIEEGDPFNIARFKTVRGHFTDVNMTGSYCISVWIFSSEGDLLFFKDYFIDE
ncbi:MAG: hypothetical protein AVO39_06710 [delta proteobacterium MLS_D]|nr:MAG: hypothetical protein AVO39_06710 [delta proteobacterium MLS_D]